MRENVQRWTRLAYWTMLVFAVLVGSVQAADQDDEYYELMKTFVDTFEQIERNYVKEVDRRELMEAAIRGMIGRLDQYSNYISPEDLARFTQDVEQEFGGIGIQVQIDAKTKRLAVISPLPGTPAYKAGVRAGDIIWDVEGKTTEGITLSEAVSLLKGKAGDPVTIGIKHEGSNEVEQVTIIRAVIHVSTVLGDTYKDDDSWKFMFDDKNKLGYIRLTHFSRHSADELSNALNELKSQGMKGLILDLRFNPGGLLSQATKIADMFIEAGKIVSTKGRNSRPREWTATKKGTFSGFPMAILVNRYSASASEIVSACLQDHKRAVIIGERTWGKGSVQNVIDLEGGSSALKLTTASYHRPSGKNIHKFPGAKEDDEWGVMPDEDFEVKFSTQQLQDYLQYRRDRDILNKEGPPESEFKDLQIAKAIEYVSQQLAEKKPKTTDTDTEKKSEAKETTEEKKSAGKSPKKDAKPTDKPEEKTDKAGDDKTPKKKAEKKPADSKSDGGAAVDFLRRLFVPRTAAA